MPGRAGPHGSDFFAGQPGYYDVKTQSWVSVAGRESPGEKDLFVQLDYMCGAVLANGTVRSQPGKSLPLT